MPRFTMRSSHPVTAATGRARGAYTWAVEAGMFGWFKKDPVKELEKAYEAKTAEALNAQRSGDIPAFALLTEEAERIAEKLEEARKNA